MCDDQAGDRCGTKEHRLCRSEPKQGRSTSLVRGDVPTVVGSPTSPGRSTLCLKVPNYALLLPWTSCKALAGVLGGRENIHRLLRAAHKVGGRLRTVGPRGEGCGLLDVLRAPLLGRFCCNPRPVHVAGLQRVTKPSHGCAAPPCASRGSVGGAASTSSTTAAGRKPGFALAAAMWSSAGAAGAAALSEHSANSSSGWNARRAAACQYGANF